MWLIFTSYIIVKMLLLLSISEGPWLYISNMYYEIMSKSTVKDCRYWLKHYRWETKILM